jgi:hypothetical protein
MIADDDIMRILILCALAFAFAACGSTPKTTNPACGNDGVMLLAWTVRGQAPSSTSCAGIDTLQLILDSDCDQVEIEPIPCALARFRYDGLPTGAGDVVVQGVDQQKRVVVQGEAMVNLTSAVPATPTPLSLE